MRKPFGLFFNVSRSQFLPFSLLVLMTTAFIVSRSISADTERDIMPHNGASAHLDHGVSRSDGLATATPCPSPGSLDATFGTGGIVSTQVGSNDDSPAKSVAIQADGKIVVVGSPQVAVGISNTRFGVVRYNADGSLDTTFGGTGKVLTQFGTNDDASAVAIQVDGKIVVAGRTTIASNGAIAIARYNTDGSLDTLFDGDGKATYVVQNSAGATSLAIQLDGKIVMAGSSFNGVKSSFTVVRLNADGLLDTSFNGTGKVSTSLGNSTDVASALAIQSDGKIVAAGYTYAGSVASDDSAVVRYNTDGSLDTSFNGNGIVISRLYDQGDDEATGIAIQADGKIVTANKGYAPFGASVVRYNTNGSLDTSFGEAGVAGTNYSIDIAYAIAIQTDGKIILAGSGEGINPSATQSFQVSRFNANGLLDVTFDVDGIANSSVFGQNDYAQAVAIQSDGKIVAAGRAQTSARGLFGLVRFNGGQCAGCTTAGSLDTSFNVSGKLTTPIGSSDDIGRAVAIQSDGRIVVAGNTSNSNIDIAIARYNTDGTSDTSFNGTGKVTTPIGSGNDAAFAVAIQSDGRIVAAGYSNNGSNFDIALVRYNTDGTLDTTFNGTGKVITPIGNGDDSATSVAVQSNGRIVVAGISNNGSDNDFAVVRYNANGSLDTSFNGTGKVTTPIGTGNDVARSVAIQSDGRIVVAGSSRSTKTDVAIARYNQDGSLDTSFNGTGKVTTPVGSRTDQAYAVSIQSDGRIVVVGDSDNGSNIDFALVRYNTNGTLDTSFNATGKVTTAIGRLTDSAQSIAIQSDGRIIAAGYTGDGVKFDFALVRYNPDGSIDTSFGNSGKIKTFFGTKVDVALAVAAQTDGRILAAGYTNKGADYDFAIARYLGATSCGAVPTPTPTPTPQSSATISGRVTTPDGRGLRNANVRLIDPNNILRTVTTSSFGFYTIDNVVTGQSYTITVGSRLYRFTPLIRQVTGDLTNLDFVGSE